MTYKGHIEKGQVVFDEPVSLEDGTSVAISVVTAPNLGGSEIARRRYELYKNVIGAVEDSPEDLSENHDRYLRELYGG